jgi:hypothetical protein
VENSLLLRKSEEFILNEDGTDMDAGAEYNPEASNAKP